MRKDEGGLQRRVAGYHDWRMDGITDLVLRARDSTVLDIGCNRGLVGFEFANNGARLVHGCDNYVEGIATARHLFCDLRNVRNQFEVVDLTQGPAALKVFGGCDYDIVLMLATYHKIARQMPPDKLTELIRWIGGKTLGWFGWRGTTEKLEENEREIVALDKDLGVAGLTRVHTSHLSIQLGAAAIWSRK